MIIMAAGILKVSTYHAGVIPIYDSPTHAAQENDNYIIGRLYYLECCTMVNFNNGGEVRFLNSAGQFATGYVGNGTLQAAYLRDWDVFCFSPSSQAAAYALGDYCEYKVKYDIPYYNGSAVLQGYIRAGSKVCCTKQSVTMADGHTYTSGCITGSSYKSWLRIQGYIDTAQVFHATPNHYAKTYIDKHSTNPYIRGNW